MPGRLGSCGRRLTLRRNLKHWVYSCQGWLMNLIETETNIERMGYRDHGKLEIAWPSGAKDQQLIILIDHPCVILASFNPTPAPWGQGSWDQVWFHWKGWLLWNCTHCSGDGFLEEIKLCLDLGDHFERFCWLEDWQLRDSFYAGALQSLQTRYLKTNLIRPSQEFVIEAILQKIKHKNTLDLNPPKYLQSNSPINMMHSPQIPCPDKNFAPSKAHLGNDFGLWSAQLALPWWCPDPCCGMWRSLSATVDPQRSEIQDGRVVPRTLRLGSSVVCVIPVTYGFLMAFTI